MRPLKYIACGIIGFAIPFVVTFLFSGCLLKDAVGLDRSRTTDNRTTNITINEAQGEAFYRDGDGWTWVLDKFCTVIDGPFDLTGDKDPQATKPTAPNPPPPCEGQTIIPEPEQANVWWLLLILLAAPGCAINFAANGRASLIDTAEVQPSLALSVGSRVHAASSASKANANSATEADAEGGTSSESSDETENEPEGNE